MIQASVCVSAACVIWASGAAPVCVAIKIIIFKLLPLKVAKQYLNFPLQRQTNKSRVNFFRRYAVF